MRVSIPLSAFFLTNVQTLANTFVLLDTEKQDFFRKVSGFFGNCALSCHIFWFFDVIKRTVFFNNSFQKVAKNFRFS